MARREARHRDPGPTPRRVQEGGRSKSAAYLVNPNLYASQNRQNAEPASPTPAGGGANGDSGDFATDEDDPWWADDGDRPVKGARRAASPDAL